MDKIGAVNAAAHADDAVVILALAGLLDRLDHPVEFGLAAFAGVPMGLNLGIERVAMVTDPARIEGDGAVGGVHDTIGADRLGGIHLDAIFRIIGRGGVGLVSDSPVSQLQKRAI